MKKLLILIPVLLLISCISEQEQEAIQELSVYGGEITISNGVISSTESGTVKFKKIIVNGSGTFEEGVVDPEILASKFAITVFNKLKPEDRDFDQIEVEFNKSDGISYSYQISKSKLEKIESEFQFVNQWVKKIQNDEIEESYKYLNTPSPILPELDPYIKKFESLKSKFGSVESVWFDGYVYENVDDSLFKGEIHQFIYDIRSKNGVYAIHVLVNPEDKGYKIYGLSFDE